MRGSLNRGSLKIHTKGARQGGAHVAVALERVHIYFGYIPATWKPGWSKHGFSRIHSKRMQIANWTRWWCFEGIVQVFWGYFAGILMAQFEFDGILLKPCLLQPCLHVAGTSTMLPGLHLHTCYHYSEFMDSAKLCQMQMTKHLRMAYIIMKDNNHQSFPQNYTNIGRPVPDIT